MRRALLISGEPAFGLDLALRWASSGDAVTVVLLDSAAAVARASHPRADAVVAALSAGAAVAAHDDALRRRALAAQSLVDGVKVWDLDEVADLVADGADRVMWL